MADRSYTSFNIPYKHTSLFIYATDLYARDGQVYYRATDDTNILNLADEDIQRLSKDRFTSKYAVIITFVDISHHDWFKEKQTFQAVIASNLKQTYVILNYLKLSSPAMVGFYENDCNFKTFLKGKDTRLLAETSNIGIAGTHVFLLTSLACEGNS